MELTTIKNLIHNVFFINLRKYISIYTNKFMLLSAKDKVTYGIIIYIFSMYWYMLFIGMITMIPYIIKTSSVHSYLIGYTVGHYYPINQKYLVDKATNTKKYLMFNLNAFWNNKNIIDMNDSDLSETDNSINNNGNISDQTKEEILSIPNTASQSERDPQPEAGVNTALGNVFNSNGENNDGIRYELRHRSRS